MAQTADILVFGSAIVDFVVYSTRLPKVGETLIGRKFANGFGGKGANQCVAAAKLGAKAALVAKVGEDSWGEEYKRNLDSLAVDTTFVESISGQTTGIAQITVADSGDNQIVIVTGANDLLSAEDVTRASCLFQNSKILICQLETPIEATIFALKQFKGISILNGAPAIENPHPDLLQFSDILCVNETEAWAMTKTEIKTLSDAKKAALKLNEMGAKVVIITLGEQGAVYRGNEKGMIETVHVKPMKVDKVLDTTGAGDCFIGSLAYFLAKYPEQSLHQQIGAANLVASISVQYPGTQSSFPTAKDVKLDFSKKQFEWSVI